ncbi:MAG: hypothetical protein PHH44_01745 [bacterium]|nr:hypothetical protein [bacterium]
MQESFKEMIKELKTFFAPENMYFNQDLQFVKTRMVVTEEKLAPLLAILDKFYKGPFKPAGEKPAREMGDLEVIQALNGIRKEQTLYLNTNDAEYVYFAAIWPWQSDPSQASLFLGLHFGGLLTPARKVLMENTKKELEAVVQ